MQLNNYKYYIIIDIIPLSLSRSSASSSLSYSMSFNTVTSIYNLTLLVVLYES